jgi:hypothetical protein
MEELMPPNVSFDILWAINHIQALFRPTHKGVDEFYSLWKIVKQIQIGREPAELWNAKRDVLEKLISQNLRLFFTKGQWQNIRTKHQLLIKALKNCIPFRNIIKYIQIGREPADLWDAKTRDAIETNTPKRGILFSTGNQIITMH